MTSHCLLHDVEAAFLFISPSSKMTSSPFDILHIPASKRRRNDLMHCSRTLMPEFEFYLSIPFIAPIAIMPIAENRDFLKSFISSNRRKKELLHHCVTIRLRGTNKSETFFCCWSEQRQVTLRISKI